jgi:hypothetical protein
MQRGLLESYRRYHESLNNVMQSDVYFGRGKVILHYENGSNKKTQKMRQFIEDCGMSPEAPAKALARFLTERGVQTPSGRSTTWQATTVQRMKARW